jgi:hypothetical protein
LVTVKLTLRIGENSASIAIVPTGSSASGARPGVAAAGGDGQLHRDLAVLGQGADAVLGVEDRDAVDSVMSQR